MADNPQTQSAQPRPLSPFISIYRWPVTMAASITHRVTGVGLALGMILVAWMLIAVATGPNAYETFVSSGG
jgi:succinate dehydrogenase / fumarate reductase cytochrome b subunit